MFASPTSYILTPSGFPLLNWGIFYKFSEMIANFPAVLNFNRLFSNSTSSFGSNCRFSPIIGSNLHTNSKHASETYQTWKVLHAKQPTPNQKEKSIVCNQRLANRIKYLPLGRIKFLPPSLASYISSPFC